jgi:hypothetical protein
MPWFFCRAVWPAGAFVVRRHSENDLMRVGFKFCFLPGGFWFLFFLGFEGNAYGERLFG